MPSGFVDYELDAEIYADTGCELHPACLSCPLPACVEDTSFYQAKAERDAGIRQDFVRGMTPEQLAAAYGLSKRRVLTIVQPVRPPTAGAGAQKNDGLPVRATHRNAMGGKKTAVPSYSLIF